MKKIISVQEFEGLIDALLSSNSHALIGVTGAPASGKTHQTKPFEGDCFCCDTWCEQHGYDDLQGLADAAMESGKPIIVGVQVARLSQYIDFSNVFVMQCDEAVAEYVYASERESSKFQLAWQMWHADEIDIRAGEVIYVDTNSNRPRVVPTTVDVPSGFLPSLAKRIDLNDPAVRQAFVEAGVRYAGLTDEQQGRFDDYAAAAAAAKTLDEMKEAERRLKNLLSDKRSDCKGRDTFTETRDAMIAEGRKVESKINAVLLPLQNRVKAENEKIEAAKARRKEEKEAVKQHEDLMKEVAILGFDLPFDFEATPEGVQDLMKEIARQKEQRTLEQQAALHKAEKEAKELAAQKMQLEQQQADFMALCAECVELGIAPCFGAYMSLNISAMRANIAEEKQRRYEAEKAENEAAAAAQHAAMVEQQQAHQFDEPAPEKFAEHYAAPIPEQPAGLESITAIEYLPFRTITVVFDQIPDYSLDTFLLSLKRFASANNVVIEVK